MHELDIRCNAIFAREFNEPLVNGETGEWETFESIRKDRWACGFTFAYLDVCSRQDVKPKLEVVIELSKHDMKRGAVLAEVVFTCCQYIATKELIDKKRVYLLYF